MRRWLPALLLGAALAGAPAADAAVSFVRADIPLPSGPESVALGDLDGRNGLDIVVALPAAGNVGVLLNNGDGTFAAMQPYSAGPQCAGLAVDITLGDVTQPAPGDRLQPDGKLDAYVACTPYVARLTGDGAGALTNPEAINLGVQQYLGSGTLDMLTLMRRPDPSPIPLLVLQHAVGSFGRQLCISYELDPNQLVCSNTPVQGPLAAGDINGSTAGVPPDEIFTSEPPDNLGVFGFGTFPLMWSDSTRPVPGGVESVALGDLDHDLDLDVVVGQPVNSLSARVDSIHYFEWGAMGLDQVATALPSTPGVDAVAVADVDGDTYNDIVAAGTYGTGMVHLGDGLGGFDGGQDLPQLGYGDPSTATRTTLAVGDLSCDGRPEIVIADQRAAQVMVYANASAPAGGSCAATPTPTPTPSPTSTPTPAPPAPRTCSSPGTVPFTLGTSGADVLVGTAGRDVLNGRGGADCAFGRAGDDRISGGSGADVLRGSGGDDRLKGDAGADKVDGGNGNDDITPGSGKDKVTAGGGNDTISARDGTRDTIDCGGGHDKAKADHRDSVKSNCESVKRS
ncbi:MAG: hypothetical protein QOI80_1920 [Solirubrobacteraceae bacterium]|nr:hypothetical protein [Solirubrobacteraceae bacterium]